MARVLVIDDDDMVLGMFREVIELLDHIADAPKALFVAQHPKGLLKHDLPEARGGTMQLLVETESDLVRTLQDPGSEVFLL